MKPLTKLILLFCTLIFSGTYISCNDKKFAGTLSEKERAELKTFTSQLIELMGGKDMTPEEKSKMIDQTVEETEKMHQSIQKLPPDEKKKVEDELEDAVKNVLNDDAFKDIFKGIDDDVTPMEELPPKIEQDEETEEVKPDKEEAVSDTISHDAKDLKVVLESLIARIDSLFVKIKSLPRVSSDKQIEMKWNKLKSSLSLLESLMRILTKKDNLLNLLASKDYTNIKDNLSNFKIKFEPKEIKFKVPDRAGLTIVYDEEEDDAEYETAQNAFKEIISIIETVLNGKILEQLKEFFEKNAPEEIKKNPKVENELSQINKVSFGGPSISTGERHFNTYPRPSGNYYDGGPRAYPEFARTQSSTPTAPTPAAFPKTEDDKTKSNSKKAKATARESDKSNETDKTKDKDREDKSKSDKEKDKKTNPSLDKQLTEFKTSLKSLSDSLSKTNALQATEDISKNTDDRLKMRDFSNNLNELEMNYEKALKNVSRLSGSLKILQTNAQKNYKENIKKAYYDPELKLEDFHSDLKSVQERIKKMDSLSSVKDKIDTLIESHDNLRKMAGEIDKDVAKQLNEFKTSLKSLSNSYKKADLESVIKSLKNNSLDVSKLTNSLNELEKHYEKLKDNLSRSTDVLKSKSEDDLKSFKLYIKSAYDSSKLELSYNQLKEILASRTIPGHLSKKIQGLADKHDALIEATNIEDEEAQDLD